jgi:hypothetical protein
MLCEPSVSDDVLICAWAAPFKAALPIVTQLSLKVMVPDGVTEPDDGVTPAVNVTLPPSVEGLTDEFSAVFVAEIMAGKLAVTDFGPFIVRFCGLVLPARSPENPPN